MLGMQAGDFLAAVISSSYLDMVVRRRVAGGQNFYAHNAL